MDRVGIGRRRGIEWRGRLESVLLLAASSMLLVLGVRMEANVRGFGTHIQLGLAPCGFFEASGIPCGTCGMTTAFTLAAHGKLSAAFATQPAGALFAMLTAALVIVSGYALVAGASLRPLVRWMWQPVHVLLLAVLVVGAWAYKVVVMAGSAGL